MKISDFESFKTQCEFIGNCAKTIVEVRDCSQYGWWGASYMTDKFGGVYTNLCYIVKDGKMYNHVHTTDEKILSSWQEVFETVIKERDELLKVRDLNGVSEFVNAQYY